MTTTPAGWYHDPNGSVRWWDGQRWTDAVQVASESAPGSSSPAAGASTSTVWVWLVALLPLLNMVLMFGYLSWMQSVVLRMIESAPYLRSSPDAMIAQQTAIFANPWFLAIGTSSWILFGLQAWFAYLDRTELVRRGSPRPFHWAWVFLGSTVYVIGRCVVVRRQTGSGFAPAGAAIAVDAAWLLFAGVWMVAFMTQVLSVIARLSAAHG